MDLGSEDYNVYGYFSSARNNYYRSNAEGQNVLCLLSDPANVKFGQYSKGGGEIVKTFSNEYGSYAIMDNSSVYLDNVVAANRGIFVTNDRKTTVIQDEIVFENIAEGAWIAQTASDITIDPDGTTAYFTQKINGKIKTVRATLVAKNPKLKLKFSAMTAYDFLLDSTARPEYSTSNGGRPEYDRSAIKKLVIVAPPAISFNVAVVFELVELDNEPEVGYTWCDMEFWTPYSDDRVHIEEESLRGSLSTNDLIINTKAVSNLYEQGNAFQSSLDLHYRRLTDMQLIVTRFNPDNYKDKIKEAYDTYTVYKEQYDLYTTTINSAVYSGEYLAMHSLGLY